MKNYFENNSLIYVFTCEYIPFKKAQELAQKLNSLKSEYSEEFIVNEYIEDKDIDNRIVCGKVTKEDWNNLNLEQHDFIRLTKIDLSP